ncbi:hypothetical protein BP6252_05247 [Coleophoma cylindrospora]|uniref:Uncharacterized protein n=1 Tax=Coleophoma cylindrospora TaxID=1849047 RepID=A0A3D8RTL2_9HELO|nr:hypothetical protein BP6252_05247 [Coleophoma cylindrospora]
MPSSKSLDIDRAQRWHRRVTRPREPGHGDEGPCWSDGCADCLYLTPLRIMGKCIMTDQGGMWSQPVEEGYLFGGLRCSSGPPASPSLPYRLAGHALHHVRHITTQIIGRLNTYVPLHRNTGGGYLATPPYHVTVGWYSTWHLPARVTSSSASASEGPRQAGMGETIGSAGWASHSKLTGARLEAREGSGDTSSGRPPATASASLREQRPITTSPSSRVLRCTAFISHPGQTVIESSSPRRLSLKTINVSTLRASAEHPTSRSTALQFTMSTLEHRDFRSSSVSFKRDKNHNSKWNLGMRPSAGVQTNWISGEYTSGSEAQQAKVRPNKIGNSDFKSHQNKTAKTTSINVSYAQESVSGRLHRKVDAIVDAREHTGSPLSKSLFDLLPTHKNTTEGAVTVVKDEWAVPGVLYSYDNNGASPNGNGRSVDLGCLVEQAEKKWKNEQTEKIVRGEYEVLDLEGETTVLPKAKGKKSPKQKVQVVKDVVDDDGFELI